jgi:mRNA-degrading endonuclease RelE of RelBE toxin-antitoxin system
MLNVEFSKYSEKFLKRLPSKHKKQVVNKSMSLSKGSLIKK